MVQFLVVAAMLSLTPPLPQQPDTVLDGEWVVEIVDNITVMPEAPVTLSFHGTRVSGLASCNTYMGAFSLAGPTIRTESILSTMKACDGPRMSQERDFLAALRRVERYELTKDGKLRLVTGDGKTITARRKSA